MHTLKSYIKKLGAGSTEFRAQQLWKPNVSAILKTNEKNILGIAERYRSARAFTLESSLALLADANINLQRPSSKLTHEQLATRIFGTSKQTVRNEAEMYYYTFFEDIEIFEYLARIADNLYHISYSQLRPRDDREQYLKKFSLQPLELKIFELLKKYLAPLFDGEINDVQELQMDKASKQVESAAAPKDTGPGAG